MQKQSFDFQAQLSRHPHNISGGFCGSLTTGPIVPQYFHVLSPGDKIYFSPSCFARLQDLVTAFLGEVDLHFDAFFVPLQMMFTPFGNIFCQTDDLLSSLTSQNLNKDTFPTLDLASMQSFPLTGFITGHIECEGKEWIRLLDALDCNPLCLLSSTNAQASQMPAGTPIISQDLVHTPRVSPWLFGAYQAIYQKYYRNDDFERFKVGAYNFDFYYNQTSFLDLDFATLRYCQRYRDYFTSVKVSPITSAVNTLASQSGTFPANGGTFDTLFSKINDYLGFGTGSYIAEQKRSDNSNIYPNSGGPNFAVLTPDSFVSTSFAHNDSWYPSAANIRALFAVDKFTRIYGRAGKNYDDQILAHFGYKVPHDVKHDITHIKHYRLVLNSEPVYSTADVAGGSSLGQVGGQSNGSLHGEKASFEAPVHGVFMIVAYAQTKPRYTESFSKLNLLSSRLSFPIPEFDKLGMQPMYLFEGSYEFLNNMSTRCGWTRRYQEFKQKYNRVSLVYTGVSVFSPYVLSRAPISDNSLAGYRPTPTDSKLLPAFEMFERPDALDNVMAVNYNGAWQDAYWNNPHEIFDTDPILMDFYCDAKLVSWMSETGEPDL